MDTCKTLSLTIQPDDKGDWILRRLYGPVREMLEQDKTVKPASKEEFLEKVENYPKEDFIKKVKDVAREKSEIKWVGLLTKNVFYSIPEDRTLYVTESSTHTAVHAWDVNYKGGAAGALLSVITDLLDPKVKAYAARATCIINSSGTGKSRMVDELSRCVITVPICLRPHGSRGFPPPDVQLRKYFEGIGSPRDLNRVRPALHGLVYGLLTVTREQLDSIPCDITLPEDSVDLLAEEYATRVIERQQKLAFAFRDFMTRGHSFEAVNSNRQWFYTRVIEAAKAFNNDCKRLDSSKNSPVQYINQDGRGVRFAGTTLREFIDPRRLFYTEKWQRPLIILSFDEPHVLTDGAKEGEWSMFSELRRILQRLDNNLIFSLFLSTAANFRLLSPDIKFDPSSRVVNESLLPLHPITEVSFDCLARPAREDSMTLYQVVQIDWIAHLGRPLFGSYFDKLPEGNKEDDILHFARQKLLGGKETLDKGDSLGSLACLATRFGLEFNEDEDSREVSCKQVERHMRICLAATTGFKKMITCAASEPLLAEAAFHLMSNSTASPVERLANHANLYCVDRGRRGELVAALIIMQARDASLPRHLPQRRWVFVTEFMQALLPPQASVMFLETLPTRWRKDEGGNTFRQTFDDYRLWFNHIIKVEDSKVIKPEFLWKYVTRGAMIVCKDNQVGIDIILPVVYLHGNISRQTVTAIIIQVKNDAEYGLDVKNKLFDAMDPCGLGLLPDNPRPIIRMVFALASPKDGVRFPPRRSGEPHYPDNFTSFDVWCAGLSTETFGQIGNDLDSYRKLLYRSQRSHDAFDVSEPDSLLKEDTKILVGKTRRSMAPLVRFHGHDEIHSRSE